MFGIGMQEVILILVIALIVIGPKKLPEIASALGKGYAEFRRAFDEMKHSVEKEFDAEELRKTFLDVPPAPGPLPVPPPPPPQPATLVEPLPAAATPSPEATEAPAARVESGVAKSATEAGAAPPPDAGGAAGAPAEKEASGGRG